MRPIASATVLRLDETVARFENPTTQARGTTWVTSAIGTYRLSPRIAALGRLTWLANDPPGAEASGTALANPILGLTALLPLSAPHRAAAFLGATVPIGQGGGLSPDATAAAAMARGVPARSSFDNALFAPNHFTVIVGLGLARVTPAYTAQVEATLLRLLRARGPETVDAQRTNLTLGLHAGHFRSPRLSLGADLRYQRWLTDAAPVRGDAAARENLTLAIGPRMHVRLWDRMFRPGIAYAWSLDRPFSSQKYDVLQIDLPLAF
jgi:hypothetical protein